MAVHTNQLVIIQVNVNSIVSNHKRYSLLRLTEEHNPDIVLINETKLTPKHSMSFKQYQLIRNDRPDSTQGGGVAILIRNTIKFHNLTPQVAFKNNENNSIEACAIRLKTTNNTYLIICCVYAPGHNRASFIDDLNDLFINLNIQSNDLYIIAGDLNARHTDWGDHGVNSRGGFLKNWIQDKATELNVKLYVPDSPTFPQAGTYLDICLADARLNIDTSSHASNKVKTLDYDSDHRGISITVSLENLEIMLNTLSKTNYTKNFRMTNWAKFRLYLIDNDNIEIPANRNLSNSEIDDFTLKMESSIQEAINSIVPVYKPTNSMIKYINPKIERLFNKKSKLLTALNKTKRKRNLNEPSVKNYIHNLQTQLYSIKYDISKEFAIACNSYWANKQKSINHRDNATFFPSINSVFRPKNMPPIHNIRIPKNDSLTINRLQLDTTKLKCNNDSYISNDSITALDIIGSHFERVNAAKTSDSSNETHKKIEKFYEDITTTMQERTTQCVTYTTFSLSNPASSPDFQVSNNKIFYSTAETIEILNKLKNKVSTGIDLIPNVALKNITISFASYYTILFNNIINNSYFPSRWKTGKILPIPKKEKDPMLAESYRPISLQPNISKVLEALLNSTIVNFAEDNKIISNYQYGFRYKHSTINAVHKLTADICTYLNSHQMVGACLIDLQQAFDSVWIKGLLYKLHELKFPEHVIHLTWHMTRQRFFIMSSGGDTSSRTFAIEDGLQQGTVNAPFWFNVYTYELLNLFEQNLTRNVHAIAFADDYIAYVGGKYPSEIQPKLESLCNKINRYYTDWLLKVNSSKCETILFRLPTNRLSKKEAKDWRSFNINFISAENVKTAVPHKTSVKYLGIHLDQLLRIKKHIDRQLEKATKALKANSRLFYSRNLNSNAKLICYALLIRPIVTYGAPIWYNTNASTMERLRTFERKCFRACLRNWRSSESEYQRYISNRKIYDAAKLPRIDNYILKICRNYFASIKHSDNPSINKYAHINADQLIAAKNSGYLPPETFTILDNNDYLQNANNVPVIYHWSRSRTDKSLPMSIKSQKLMYSTVIPNRDANDLYRASAKYWWLTDSIATEEIRKRSKHKNRRNM